MDQPIKIITLPLSPEQLQEMMQDAALSAISRYQPPTPEAGERWAKLSTVSEQYDISVIELRRIIKANQPEFLARAAKKLGDWRVRVSDVEKFVLSVDPLGASSLSENRLLEQSWPKNRGSKSAEGKKGIYWALK